MEFRSERLENGLEVIAETNGEAHSMSVAFIVRTGSRDETVEVAGVSHFLEHMCFKGTPRRSADDVNREFDEIGARLQRVYERGMHGVLRVGASRISGSERRYPGRYFAAELAAE